MANGSVYQLIRDGKPVLRKSGKPIWCVEYKAPDGKRVTKSTFVSKREAESFLAEITVEKKRGVHVAERDSITVEKAAENWLKDAEAAGLERSTQEQYERHVRIYINPKLGTTKLSKLTLADVSNFRDDVTAGWEGEGGKRIGSPAMAGKVFTSLRSIISLAQEKGFVATNVCAAARRKKKSKRHAPTNGAAMRIPTIPEIEALEKAAAEHYPGKMHAMLSTAILTGLRLSELRGLRWANVDLDAGKLQVVERANEWGEIGSPKSETSWRTMDMGKPLVATMRAWKLAQPLAERGKNLVFPNGAGNVESASNLHHRFVHPVQVQAKLIGEDEDTRFSWHDFRHLYASIHIANGRTVVEVQHLLGHSTPSTTLNTYAHLFQATGEKRNAGDDIAAALFGASQNKPERKVDSRKTPRKNAVTRIKHS
ncbi:Integrase [Paramagnetospirillum magnetotacticum MS-1]|uniref:Integrase n=1 Tax=Paramagnetospirillum magnetotacticum MS-1 TaxID=272627 RepID=A0A0C2UF83_PARME|nr:site-specific integrase [Paramagnetospirillum magnetotacticum]KIM00153.1 Integrase [Paramagnetospirillum magnetotacticum MS-1]